MIAVDTNVLLLYVVGSTRPDYIEKHKRLDAYLEDDFLLLVDEIGGEQLLMTPNTLSEVSNLLVPGVKEPLRTGLRDGLASIVFGQSELYVASAKASRDALFAQLGLTDCVLLNACKEKNARLVTVDAMLYSAALSRGIDAVNFNHLRDPKF